MFFLVEFLTENINNEVDLQTYFKLYLILFVLIASVDGSQSKRL